MLQLVFYFIDFVLISSLDRELALIGAGRHGESLKLKQTGENVGGRQQTAARKRRRNQMKSRISLSGVRLGGGGASSDHMLAVR